MGGEQACPALHSCTVQGSFVVLCCDPHCSAPCRFVRCKLQFSGAHSHVWRAEGTGRREAGHSVWMGAAGEVSATLLSLISTYVAL